MNLPFTETGGGLPFLRPQEEPRLRVRRAVATHLFLAMNRLRLDEVPPGMLQTMAQARFARDADFNALVQNLSAAVMEAVG